MPAGNPLANLLVVIAGALTIAVSVVVGFFAFVALAGFILVVATVIGIRTWWFNRQLRKQSQQAGAGKPAESSPGDVFEGEFRIVDRVVDGNVNDARKSDRKT